MYRYTLRICGNPNRAKYALCVYDDSDFRFVPFIRTYQTYARYTKALAGYLSHSDLFAVTFVKHRGEWLYSSLSHTSARANTSLLDSVRRAAIAQIDYYFNCH